MPFNGRHATTVPSAMGRNPLSVWLAEALSRQRALAVFAMLKWAAMMPALLAWGLDDRALRGVNAWIKPLKFLASVGLFALSTAWFIGLLPSEKRTHPSIKIVVWTLIGTGLFEIACITWQAALGIGSHHNTTTALHGLMYTLMEVGSWC